MAGSEFRGVEVFQPGELAVPAGGVEVLLAAWDGLVSGVVADMAETTAKKYRERLQHFETWLRGVGGGSIGKVLMADYRRALVQTVSRGRPWSASTVNGHMVAARALLREAEDAGLIGAHAAERAASVEGVKALGTRSGNWLSLDEAQRLLDSPDTSTLRGKRDRAMLAVMLYCGLRRHELAALTVEHLQMREGHNVIADMLGKGGRVRTVPVPVPVRRAIDAWLEASGRETSPASLVFVALRKGGQLAGTEALSAQAIYNLVREYGALIGKPELAPHDLRRTFARLARRGGAALESISSALGHASIATTQRYLGDVVDFDNAAPFRVGLAMGR